MNIKGKHYRTIWETPNTPSLRVNIIDQRRLPHRLVIETLSSAAEAATAIRDMHVRGAPLIGAAAAYGMALAVDQADGEGIESAITSAAEQLRATRPTAVNLDYAVRTQLNALNAAAGCQAKRDAALHTARRITEDSTGQCRRIGEHGLPLIRAVSAGGSGRPVNILTHCNAGWLATVDYGTATAPIYAAHDAGVPVHVWVDETRPRNQGARLTAFELGEHGVPHTVISDNAGGHLMQHGLVDLVIVGSDRTTVNGDVANKIGTYLKALAARDNGVPFYVALPGTTIDFSLRDGVREIPIEKRPADEVKTIQGLLNGEVRRVLLTPENSPARNDAFDVTPARLVTGLITERGVCAAEEGAIRGLFPKGTDPYE